ncbi:type VI secretion protein [Martelella alba]|uniref:Type VI secretion protein n=1 Tax=Martelella alba TaxID=2590451 RepID=A0A506U3D6_9HYPH|nr:type IV secretory system conjugative DNA transfer family protein [Martelella alba]TPW27059.1 type VI secretion protein [Martelella alba]
MRTRFSEIRGRQIGGALIIAIFAAAIGYVVATGIVQYWYGQPEPDLLWIARHWWQLRTVDLRVWNIINVTIGGFFLAGLLLATRIVTERLTRFGSTHWMSGSELAKKNFFADPCIAFTLGKTGKPAAKGGYIASGAFPHCLLVAPTGRGKNVGFVIPNLLTYLGSAVVLDVKGENFEMTARFRKKMGHAIYRFCPRDFDQPSFRYNPLDRIKTYSNRAKRMAELEKIATLFLQTEDSSAAGFLPNSREVFIACAILAYEQDNLTLGQVYRLAFGGALNNNAKFAAYADEVKDPEAKVLFQKLSNTTEKTLSAYLSVLSSAGMSTWMNPHTCAVTNSTDFDFATFRKKPQTVYFNVPTDDIEPIAPLARLFFSDLVATMQHHEPGKDEPFPVLILLDEFQRLGKMPKIVDSISLLRSYGVNLAIVTQSIPELERHYGENGRKTIQAGTGIKLYLTPSEEDTIAEMSASVGTTTKRVVSKSRSQKDGMFGTSVSERTEEHPLLTKDEARRMPLDEIIIVVDADMPIRAKRIVYYEDSKYKPLFESQDFTAPLPLPPHTITEADYVVMDVAASTQSAHDAQEDRLAKAKAAATAQFED